jgi:hypothetical protein
MFDWQSQHISANLYSVLVCSCLSRYQSSNDKWDFVSYLPILYFFLLPEHTGSLCLSAPYRVWAM